MAQLDIGATEPAVGLPVRVLAVRGGYARDHNLGLGELAEAIVQRRLSAGMVLAYATTRSS